MKTAPSVAAPRLQRSRIARLVLAVVVTVPLVYAALYMWMMWDPTTTIDRMPVALVNQDRPAQQGQTTVDAGADVTQNLLDSGALDFHRVDADRAAQGVADGSYYFAVEIPEDFSRTIADIGSTTVAPALINVAYNDFNTLMASNIGARAMSAINTAVLQGVSNSTVGTVITGVETLGNGLRSAAVGSAQVHEGTSEIAAGGDQLAAGLAGQLAPGAVSAAEGGGRVASGASDVATGLTQLQGGTDTLGAGAQQVADGVDRLVETVDVDGLQTQLAQLRTLLPTTGTDQALGGVDQVSALLTGLQQLQSGSRQIATELTDPTAAWRSGLDRLVTGSAELSSGADELATGLTELSEGTAQSAQGAIQLQQGARRLDDGAAALATGLADGVSAVPDLGDQNQQDTLAGLLSTPVASSSTNTAPAQFGGPGGAPALLVIASALIPLVVLMSFRAHRYVTAGEPPITTAAAIRRFLTVAAVSLVAMAVVAPILWSTLTPSPDPASVAEVTAVAAVATMMNTALGSLLFTLFGYAAGALAYLAALMLQVFSYGGVWMVETLPAPFRWLHPIAPMTYVRDGFIAAFNGVAGFGSAVAIVSLIAAVALAINFMAYRAERVRHHPPEASQSSTLAAHTADAH